MAVQIPAEVLMCLDVYVAPVLNDIVTTVFT